MNQFNLLVIGDTSIDAFIRLKEAELHCDISREECKICLKFASKIPYESITEVPAGGNSANVALGSAKLNLTTTYLTNIGYDDNGQKILTKLKKAGINPDLIKVHANLNTNYNYVLWYADDRTILVHHENYPYKLPSLPKTNWVYLTSLGENSLELHQELVDQLDKNPDTKLAFSPGTMQIRVGHQELKEIYKRTEIFFANKQEVMKILETDKEEVAWLANKIKDLGPQIVVITDGNQGSFALDSSNLWHSPIFPTENNLLERTGAGDAFASAFLAAIIENLSVPEALAWGAVNSASVVQKIGPHEGLLSSDEIKRQLSQKNISIQKI
ncbi:MAG: carbohydrate kinase family protein [Candidatus Paceibacterota bacterium]|jgi:sugar/nucleoside kinase (ribokinase family)